MQRSNFRLASLARQVELAIVFFGLPNAINNPSPLIIIEAIFSYQKVNTCIITRPSAEPMCSMRLFG